MVLNATDRQLIALIQGGLPLVSNPYAVVGDRLGIDEAEVIERITKLQSRGLIKRMGVVVSHRVLGYRANAMAVWDIPDELVEAIGQRLATEECVTLCYQRPRRLPDWPYNLFCMIHGRERQAVLCRLAVIIDHNDLGRFPHSVLFSRRGFKQRGAHYVTSLAPESREETAHG